MTFFQYITNLVQARLNFFMLNMERSDNGKFFLAAPMSRFANDFEADTEEELREYVGDWVRLATLMDYCPLGKYFAGKVEECLREVTDLSDKYLRHFGQLAAANILVDYFQGQDNSAHWYDDLKDADGRVITIFCEDEYISVVVDKSADGSEDWDFISHAKITPFKEPKLTDQLISDMKCFQDMYAKKSLERELANFMDDEGMENGRIKQSDLDKLHAKLAELNSKYGLNAAAGIAYRK